MSDKRQEFVGKWTGRLFVHFSGKEYMSLDMLDEVRALLLEYDKLNGDRWARLKEFVEAELLNVQSVAGDDWYRGQKAALNTIKNEILWLEEGK